jgi:hypothetical protein
MAPSTQRPAVILPRQRGIEDCAKTSTVKGKSRSASSRPDAYQLANDRSCEEPAPSVRQATIMGPTSANLHEPRSLHSSAQFLAAVGSELSPTRASKS